MKMLIGGLCAAYLTISAAQAETVLKVSSYLPPKHTFTEAVTQWGADLSAATNGELRVEVYPAGQLGPVNRQFDLVSSGAVDAAIILHSATPGRFPLSSLAGAPFSHPAAGDSSAITSRRFTELAPELAGEHPRTKILWMGVTPPLKINLAKTDPTDLAALKGQRMRYAGEVFQQVLDKMGAVPMPVPPAETAESLAKGIVDGALFPYEAVMAFDLGPELNYSLEPGLASVTFAFVMNQRSFDGLTPEQQAAVVETTGPERAAAFGAQWDANEQKGRSYLVDANKVTIVSMNDAQQAQMKTLVTPIIDAQIDAAQAKGQPARAFYDAYVK
ncbi:hypothetical protein BFP70_05960 [Thioclava sp. SK-1]|uniref:TRAP transporter substrate-binding protein n=1 Tax=Thioclava sp. SK-1 TaxID=1889770 RepID=UPI000824663F|nr:TRAP transporter substrate-binding protein [Thioclava sp. SK-1]OCX66246.1 hypothetical protein BFP70_05960 [Thioclava sp. SK-1]